MHHDNFQRSKLVKTMDQKAYIFRLVPDPNRDWETPSWQPHQAQVIFGEALVIEVLQGNNRNAIMIIRWL